MKTLGVLIYPKLTSSGWKRAYLKRLLSALRALRATRIGWFLISRHVRLMNRRNRKERLNHCLWRFRSGGSFTGPCQCQVMPNRPRRVSFGLSLRFFCAVLFILLVISCFCMGISFPISYLMRYVHVTRPGLSTGISISWPEEHSQCITHY